LLRGDYGRVGGIATDQAMRSDDPDITLARHRCYIQREFGIRDGKLARPSCSRTMLFLHKQRSV